MKSGKIRGANMSTTEPPGGGEYQKAHGRLDHKPLRKGGVQKRTGKQ